MTTRDLMERVIAEETTRLLWDDKTGELTVEVLRGEEVLARVEDVEPDNMFDVFHHPYVYAAYPRKRTD